MTETPRSELATIGGGCFWCTEAVFQRLRGVQTVESGYAGGKVVNPTYKQVCKGSTDHAEVIQIAFDPQVISFRQLLEVFFAVHDPTTLNRQGNDVGTQYRSVIFFHNDDQRRIAEDVKRQLDDSGAYDNPLVTQIQPFSKFFTAEDYHQQYFAKNPQQPYCNYAIPPKLEKLQSRFGSLLKDR